MEHSFDIKIAKEYGIEEAIILKNIYFWIQKNTANEKHFYDGKYWTYNSKKAFSELFPYMTENKIRYALDNLKKNGLIETGNYNESSYDRTLWYTLTEKAYELFGISQMLRGKFPNGQGDVAAPSGKIHHSNNIYINNTNTNTDINTDINTDKEHKKRKNIQCLFLHYIKSISRQRRNVKHYISRLTSPKDINL